MCVKKYAVCALVLNSEGLILGVSRKDGHNDLFDQPLDTILLKISN